MRKISIHALVKRATGIKIHDVNFCCYFNPRPRQEGDIVTHPVSAGRGHFNPRPREEGDADAGAL